MTTSTLTAAWRAGRTEAARREPRRRPLLILFVSWVAAKLPRWRTVRAACLRTAGLGALTWAAFTHSFMAGLVTLGVSLLLLEWVADR